MFRAATRTSAAACDGRMVGTYTAAAAAAAAGFGRCPLVAFVHADAVLLRYESTAESLERLPGRGTGRPIREHSP